LHSKALTLAPGGARGRRPDRASPETILAGCAPISREFPDPRAAGLAKTPSPGGHPSPLPRDERPVGDGPHPEPAAPDRSLRRKAAAVVFTAFVYAPAVPCLRGDPFGPEHLPARPGEPTGFGLPSSNCLIAPVAGQGPKSAEGIPELAPGPDELVVRGHTYATAWRHVGTRANLVLRRVLNVECLRPVPVGAVVEIQGAVLHRAQVYLVTGLLGVPLVEGQGPWLEALLGFAQVDEAGQADALPEGAGPAEVPEGEAWRRLAERLQKLLPLR
jgi:hypothetical protein